MIKRSVILVMFSSISLLAKEIVTEVVYKTDDKEVYAEKYINSNCKKKYLTQRDINLIVEVSDKSFTEKKVNLNGSVNNGSQVTLRNNLDASLFFKSNNGYILDAGYLGVLYRSNNASGSSYKIKKRRADIAILDMDYTHEYKGYYRYSIGLSEENYTSLTNIFKAKYVSPVLGFKTGYSKLIAANLYLGVSVSADAYLYGFYDASDATKSYSDTSILPSFEYRAEFPIKLRFFDGRMVSSISPYVEFFNKRDGTLDGGSEFPVTSTRDIGVKYKIGFNL